MLTVPNLAMVEAPRSRRISRNPVHTFNLKTKPFGIYPFMIAPVLPGETMKNLLMQSRVVTDPVASPLIGWWVEYYYFYVKLRDLPSAYATACETMMLDPSATLASVATGSASDEHYFNPSSGTAVNWSKACLQRVVEEYFRDEGETWNAQTVDDVPLAKLNDRSWTDSLFATSEVPVASTLEGVEGFSDLEHRYQVWELLRSQRLTVLTFEDYLRTFGVNVPDSQAKGKPELLRFVREWSYPTNTVDPTTGVPASAVSWSIAERADKDRFFMEPGFIYGVTVCRPKMYRKEQKQAAVCMLDDAFAWMPALLKDDPSSSLRTFTADAGNSPLGSSWTVSATLDVRDLFMYGDQFVYPVPDNTGVQHAVNFYADTHLGSQYPTTGTLGFLFSDTDPGTAVYVKQDGVVKLSILGTQMDYT